jgi:hypothetical protein
VARVFDTRGVSGCRLCGQCTAREFAPGLWHCLIYSPEPLEGESALQYGIAGREHQGREAV